jgi:hypothetical protein
MSTMDFIIDLLCRVDEAMRDVPQQTHANLSPSEIVTLALLHPAGTRRKGVGPRRCYRWRTRDYTDWFPGLPERTRLFRLFATHADWAARFLADPTLFWAGPTLDVVGRAQDQHQAPVIDHTAGLAACRCRAA